MSLSKSTSNGETVKKDLNSKTENSDTTIVIPNATSHKKSEGSLESLELTLSPSQITPKENENYQGLNANNSEIKQSNDNSPSRQQTKFPYFQIGVSEDRNKRCRRTMEDAHSFFYDFAGVEGQGFFAIFDGHAGKQAAEWCGSHFHETFQQVLQKNTHRSIPEVFHLAFLEADKELNQSAGKHSGCTAIAAFLRTEEIKDSEVTNGKENTPQATTASEIVESKKKSKRVLYTANVGDARAVLCRDGKAIRLSYDHKGSDAQEAKRITDAGGFVMNNRVNGVLAVTRSLGDSSMKEFVVGNPYTTETILTEKDPFLILACDGLWDVCEDQDAVDLIKGFTDPQIASKNLLDHALQNFSTDNLSVMVVRLMNG
ncbi:10842_t:CDS:2 [Ambispora gerdemannii]|uniref:10842_t:CDS:1 n=1 Tax=Ambispora gerdemannii TaxID=144530 RepID=A0A9N8ZQQ3_9GLOM|nr:10842_t:CDS:2 [Ambispora gerdemannii]